MDPPAGTASGTSSSWIDRQCDQFEQDWRAGHEPRIEDILAGLPADLRVATFRELVASELELRRRRGDVIRRDEYRQRFPEWTALLDEFALSFDGQRPSAAPPGEPDAAPDSVATTVNYKDLRYYRRGGLGSLYRARDESLHRETVIKFMNESCAADVELIAQFKVEAEVTSRLDHPGIVPVYGIGQDQQGRPFYVMRLIHGRELREAIQEYHEAGGPSDRGPRNRELLCTLLEHLVRACNTVAYAHHAGIVHCDLKPANVMIGKYGETFVLDWGLAAAFERTSTFFSPNQATIRPHAPAGDSTSGRRGGTYGYVSPEQLSPDGTIGPASDIYGLGATLYEIMTGQPPFHGSNPHVREQIRNGQFRAPRSLQPKLSARLEAICRKAMSLDPGARYVTAKLLASDLTNWMRDEPLLALPDPWFARVARFARRHRGLTAACFVTLLTIVIAVGWTDRSIKTAAHEKALREQSEALRVLEERARDTERLSFTTALDTFEDLCRPFANGEMSNLAVFRPFVDKIKNFTAVYLDDFEHVESMRLNTGRVYELRGTVSRVYTSDTVQAMEDYQRAEALYQQVPATEDGWFERDLRLAQIRLGQGRLFIDRDELDQAFRVLESVAADLQRLRKQQPENPVLLRHLAEAQHGLGEVFLDRPSEGTNRSQDLRDAEQHFNQSKNLREELLKQSQGDDSRNHLRDLARSLGYLGDLYLAQGDISQAAQAYEQSKVLREDLYRTNPRNPEHRFQYARGLANFGGLERGYRGNLTRAIEQLAKAEAIQRELTNDFDEVENFWIDLGNTQNMLAEIYLFAAQDDPTTAAEMRQRCREAAEGASSVFGRLFRQKSPNGLRGLAESSITLAVLQRTADPAESQRLAQDAEQWLSTQGREPTLSRSELVSLAMVRALLGQTESAFRALDHAVQQGENSAYRFERHASLALMAVADDSEFGPQFRSLVREVRDRLKTE